MSSVKYAIAEPEFDVRIREVTEATNRIERIIILSKFVSFLLILLVLFHLSGPHSRSALHLRGHARESGTFHQLNALHFGFDYSRGLKTVAAVCSWASIHHQDQCTVFNLRDYVGVPPDEPLNIVAMNTDSEGGVSVKAMTVFHMYYFRFEQINHRWQFSSVLVESDFRLLDQLSF